MKKFFLFLSFALVFSFMISNSQSAIWYQQNFDNLKDGEIAGQDSWEKITDLVADIGSPTVQGEIFNGRSGKALKAEAKQEVRRHFDPVHAGTQFLIIYFRKEDTSATNTLHIYIGKDVHEWAAGPVIRIGSQSGDPTKFGAHNGGTVVPVATIVPKQWHKVRVVVSYDKLSYNVYFDNTLVAEGYKFRKDVHNALGWLKLGFDSGVGVLGYYDDIIMGDGDGADIVPSSVSPTGRLATTWAGLKQ